MEKKKILFERGTAQGACRPSIRSRSGARVSGIRRSRRWDVSLWYTRGVAPGYYRSPLRGFGQWLRSGAVLPSAPQPKSRDASRDAAPLPYRKANQKPTEANQKMNSPVDLGCSAFAKATARQGRRTAVISCYSTGLRLITATYAPLPPRGIFT